MRFMFGSDLSQTFQKLLQKHLYTAMQMFKIRHTSELQTFVSKRKNPPFHTNIAQGATVVKLVSLNMST